MYRKVFEELIAWKDSPRRKPLVIKGTRQVGKTWLMLELAKTAYNDFVYVSFDSDSNAVELFNETKDPKLIIERLSFLYNKVILPEETLIILDEIQECPSALGCLKYFNEQANQYHIITAGSLLGTYLANPTSYPVGKVNLIDVYPLTFEEFLAAIDNGMYLYFSSIMSGKDYVSAFHSKMIEQYKRYLIIGGMPEAVQSWINNADPREIETIQGEIIRLYENDFTKHNVNISSGRILQVFRSIVPQLAKVNNEKFMYSVVANSARAKDFEDAIEWLVSSGIVYRVHNISKAEYPLKAYEILNYFKLFMFDVGLLKHMAGLTNNSIMNYDNFQFKGQLVENYALEQLIPIFDNKPNFYAYAQQREIDYIVQIDEYIVPIEVKSGGDRSAVSFKSYIDKYNPDIAVRLSIREYIKNGAITNIPLYLTGKIIELSSIT